MWLDLRAMKVDDLMWLDAPPASAVEAAEELLRRLGALDAAGALTATTLPRLPRPRREEDRKSTRLNFSHRQISYAVFCLKKKKKEPNRLAIHEPPHVPWQQPHRKVECEHLDARLPTHHRPDHSQPSPNPNRTTQGRPYTT